MPNSKRKWWGCTSRGKKCKGATSHERKDEHWPDPWLEAGGDWPDPWTQAEHSGTNVTSSAVTIADWEDADDPWKPASKQPRKVSMLTPSLLLQRSTTKEKNTQFEAKGCGSESVKKRWLKGCPRKCKLEGCCPKAIRLADLQALCSAFWSISVEERIHLLQATFGDEEKKLTKSHYFVGETRVCFHNFCAKLGTSQPTMRKYIKGQPDMRTNVGRKKQNFDSVRDGRATMKCDHFFQELHQSAAEAMPEDERCALSLNGDPWDEDGCFLFIRLLHSVFDIIP